MSSSPFDPSRSALLSMDLQAGIVSIYTSGNSELVSRAALLLDHGRHAGMMVIHVKVEFRRGLPEINSRNKLLGALKASPNHQRLFEGPTGSFHSDVAPIEGDIVVTKSRVNAFAGTDLELLLRARDIHTLVMFGIATSGVVLATALHAADNDYRLFIVKDCCADLDAAVHDCLVEKLLPKCAMVLSAEEMLSLIGPISIAN